MKKTALGVRRPGKADVWSGIGEIGCGRDCAPPHHRIDNAVEHAGLEQGGRGTEEVRIIGKHGDPEFVVRRRREFFIRLLLR